jgi:plastocyanin
MKKLALACAAVLAVVALLAACGGGGSATTVASCSPSGTHLAISAQSFRFETNCLAAPAHQPFTITLHNNDPGQEHNVSIYTDASATRPLFQGKLSQGPAAITYDVHPLAPGRYYFRCDVHPQMNGTFIVK